MPPTTRVIAPPPCLIEFEGGCELLVQVVPNASRTATAGEHDGALRVRLAAPAIDGRANAALLKWLCQELGLARRQARMVSGASARRKRVRLECDLPALQAWLGRQLPAGRSDAT